MGRRITATDIVRGEKIALAHCAKMIPLVKKVVLAADELGLDVALDINGVKLIKRIGNG